MKADDPTFLPPDLPVPVDDGLARHLVGSAVSLAPLPSTDGRQICLGDPNRVRTVVYCYPRTGRPGSIALGGTDDWNAIPGARGCTPQSCAYRDLHGELRALGVEVFGLSTQSTDYQREAVERLHLPFALLSDAAGEFTRALRLPTFEVNGVPLLKRLTLVIEEGRIRHCWYPVFPPDQDAPRVLAWLRANAASR